MAYLDQIELDKIVSKRLEETVKVSDKGGRNSFLQMMRSGLGTTGERGFA